MRQAVAALEELNMKGKVQLIVSGGIRTGADVAKALAMGADAVAIGQGVLIALGCNRDAYYPERAAPLGGGRTTRRSAPRPASAITATPASARSASPRRTRCSSSGCEPDVGAKHVKNYLKTLTMELTTIARACGKQNVHHLEREDLVALTVEAAAMARRAAGGNELDSGVGGAVRVNVRAETG